MFSAKKLFEEEKRQVRVPWLKSRCW